MLPCNLYSSYINFLPWMMHWGNIASMRQPLVLKCISYTGMCRPNGSFFHKKSSDMGPLFRGKTLRHWSIFPKCSQFWKMDQCLRVFPLKSGPMSKDFLWKNDPFGWHIPFSLYLSMSTPLPPKDPDMEKMFLLRDITMKVLLKWDLLQCSPNSFLDRNHFFPNLSAGQDHLHLCNHFKYLS